MLLQILLEHQKSYEVMASPSSMFQKFKDYTLFHEDFRFKISLYYIFNEQNYVTSKNGEIKFILTYQTFKLLLNKLRHYGNNSCGAVCPREKKCQGHEVLEILQNYDDFMFDSVERRAVFYRHLKFIKTGEDDDPMMGYKIFPFNGKDIGWDSWSKRMSYLLV